MPVMKKIILNHNKTILTKERNTQNTTNNGNCHVKETCPALEKSKTSSLIYQAMVTQHDNSEDELTDNTFNTQYNDHTISFRNYKYRDATALSNYISNPLKALMQTLTLRCLTFAGGMRS